MSDLPLSPGDAKRILYETLKSEGVLIVPAYVAHDLAQVRRAFPNDVDFAAAMFAIAKEIYSAHVAPAHFGSPVEHELKGWRRSKFASKIGADVKLRLIFRPAKPAGVEILAFGDRHFPEAVYFRAKNRL